MRTLLTRSWLVAFGTLTLSSAVCAQTAASSATIPPPPADPTFVDDAFVGQQIRYESVNRGEPGGDKLAEARQLAAAIVAQDKPAPVMMVDVGSHAGEFLEAFLEEFPTAKAQWTEPVEDNHANAIRRFARFGDRVSYVIGCPNRDLSLGCVPKNVDVLITSWLSIHQDLPGIRHFYKEAAAMLPSGGWLADIEHVADHGGRWGALLKGARTKLKVKGLAALAEGPRVHHLDYVMPTIEEEMAALRDAGFDAKVVWQRLDTVLIMARKP